MKRIITSIGTIVFVAAIVIGGTGAFFSDTETSTDNVFTAGSIDLTVDSEAHYNGSVCLPNNLTENPTDYTWQGGEEYPVGLPCTGTWEATDLGAQTFFNFSDIKPGDEGENTISLHITSNPAWACIDVNLTANDDVSSTEPELDGTGDVANTGDLFDGELAENIKFAAWLDQGNTPGWQNSPTSTPDAGEGDNVWQGESAEPLLFSNESGPASDVLGGKTYALADSTTGFGPMTPNVTNYIGLAWCAGTQTVGTSSVTCNGATLGNIVQTDMFEASIAFRVEQARNNEDFVCGEPTTEPEDEVLVNSNNLNGWIILNYDNEDSSDDDTTTDSGTDGNFVNGPETPPAGTGSFEQELGTDGNDAQRLVTSQFNGMPLSNMLDMEYSTYVTANDGAQATYIQLRIDLNNDGAYDDALFFEPVYQNGMYSLVLGATTPVPNQCGAVPNCVVTGEWQTWDAGIGGWWPNPVGGPPLTTLADYITANPTAKLASNTESFRIQTGFGAPVWNNFQGNFDKLIVNGTTYNFEF